MLLGLFGGFRRRSPALTVGNGADPNASLTQDVALLATSTVVDPAAVILQHLVGFSFYTGTPGPGVGTLQGGSCESSVWLSPADMGIALGFEGIARVNGDQARTLVAAIGMQGSVSAGGDATHVGELVSLRASGPASTGGNPTVDMAVSLDVHQPTVGTERISVRVVGVLTVVADGSHAPLWSVGADGIPQWDTPANEQATASAATPVKYLKIRDSDGTMLVIPAYAP